MITVFMQFSWRVLFGHMYPSFRTTLKNQTKWSWGRLAVGHLFIHMETWMEKFQKRGFSSRLVFHQGWSCIRGGFSSGCLVVFHRTSLSSEMVFHQGLFFIRDGFHQGCSFIRGGLSSVFILFYRTGLSLRVVFHQGLFFIRSGFHQGHLSSGVVFHQVIETAVPLTNRLNR